MRSRRFLPLLAAALAGFVQPAAVGVGAAQQRVTPATADEVRLSYAPVVRMTAPAVVNVYASHQPDQRNAADDFFNDPFFRRFFGDNNPSQRAQRSLGSGVIVDATGIVVTNAHVIGDANAVRVVLADQREMEAEILLRDPRADLAILRLPPAADGYPAIAFADSDRLEVGDLVLAIGNPFGLGQAVTSGIISGLARTHVSPAEYQYFIQTDAAINPGNSGGALVDMAGRLIGINTAIFSRSGGSDGIGFAIPSNMARVVATAAAAGEPVRRPWIGARTREITPEIAAGLGIDRTRGALVVDVAGDGPIASAGVIAGDVIVAIDGIDVEDPSALDYRLVTAGIGRPAVFTILRAGVRSEVTIDLIAAPETVAREEVVIDGFSPFVGARVANLSPAVAEEVGRDGGATGVVVVEVAPGSVASQVGLKPGDIVLDVNGVGIDTTSRLAGLSAERARVWRFAIERDGRVLQSMIGG